MTVIDQLEAKVEPEPQLQSPEPREPAPADPRELERLLRTQCARELRVRAH